MGQIPLDCDAGDPKWPDSRIRLIVSYHRASICLPLGHTLTLPTSPPSSHTHSFLCIQELYKVGFMLVLKPQTRNLVAEIYCCKDYLGEVLGTHEYQDQQSSTFHTFTHCFPHSCIVPRTPLHQGLGSFLREMMGPPGLYEKNTFLYI